MERDRQPITVLAFEGPDKSGKSTLIREVNRASNYRFLCIDRFTGSAWVYDRLSNRRERTTEISQIEEELSGLQYTRILNIILTCDEDKLRERIASDDEFSELRLEQLDEAMDLYRQYAEDIAQLPLIEIDTSDKSIEDTVEEILIKVQEYEQNNS